MSASASSAQPSPSLSSLVPSSNAHTSSSAASSPHLTHPQASGSRHGRRGSLSLIGSASAARVRLTQDFRSLVRSNSTSSSAVDSRRTDRRPGRIQRANSVQVQRASTDARGRNLSPHAPLLAARTVEPRILRMDKPREESRNGRSFGARLVNFLSRSRSRSRSKKRRSRSLDDIVVPVSEMPTKPLQPGSLGRHNPYVTALGNSTNTSNSTSASSGSKPITRSPSRPLSGATTVTDTTVNAKPKKANGVANGKARATSPEHHVHVQAEVLGKPKKTNIFSVSIPSPRKDPSRQSSLSVRAESSSPMPADQPSRSLWAGRFRSGSGSSAGGQSSRSNVGDPSSSRTTPPPVPPKPSASTSVSRPAVMTSVRRPTRQDTITTLNSPPPPYQTNEYEYRDPDEHAGRCSPLCGLTPPRLTPVSEKGKERERVRDAERERIRAAERERERERQREKEREKDREKETERARSARDRHNEILRERERRKGKEREVEITGPRRVGSPIVRERERGSRMAATAAQVSPVPMEKVASGGSGNSKRSKESTSAVGTAIKVKRTKHGSFDFERPVSNGMTMKTALRGLGVGLGTSAGNGYPMERSTSVKDDRSRAHGHSHSHSHRQEQPQTSSQPNSLGRSSKRPVLDVNTTNVNRHARDHSGGSNPHSAARSQFNQADFDPMTPQSSHSGHSSSWGRAAGARIARGTHGAFKFEPAVPPIPGSPASDERNGHGVRGASGGGQASKLRRDQSITKGRSLDLGLSLSWAPQRVREEAVLSYNQAGAPHATTSRVRTRWRGTGVDEQGRLDAPSSRSASTVAEEFKEALGDAAYGTFKTYVHRFDAHAIPLEGPYGLISAASRLLDNAGTLDERHKKALLDKFICFVQQNQ